jgi:2-C-methyl-D-erythritol 4-phosphate cytidylyltransferase
MEALGQPVRVVAGPSDNLKITRPDDLPLAELIIRAQIASKQACE